MCLKWFKGKFCWWLILPQISHPNIVNWVEQDQTYLNTFFQTPKFNNELSKLFCCLLRQVCLPSENYTFGITKFSKTFIRKLKLISLDGFHSRIFVLRPGMSITFSCLLPTWFSEDQSYFLLLKTLLIILRDIFILIS